MKKRKWVDALVIFAIILIACVIRIVYVNFFLDEISVSGELMQKVQAAGDNPFALFGLDLDSIYSVLLSVVMLVFGNKAVVGVGLNIFLQIVNLLLIYACIRLVSDVIAAALPTLIICSIPVYFMTIQNISSFQLFNIGITFCILVVILIIRGLTELFRHLFSKQVDQEEFYTYEEEMGEDAYPPDEYVQAPEESYEQYYTNEMQQEDTYEEQQFMENSAQDDGEYQNDNEYQNNDEYQDDGEYIEEEPIAYQDDVWNISDNNEMAPFSETELDALSEEGELENQNNATVLEQLDAMSDAQQPVAENVFDLPKGGQEQMTEMKQQAYEGNEQQLETGFQPAMQASQFEQPNAQQQAAQFGQQNVQQQATQFEQQNVQQQTAQFEQQRLDRRNKRRPEINYDFNPRNDFMHYDLEDMTGMDFFDIE